jgi:hypothetical protein
MALARSVAGDISKMSEEIDEETRKVAELVADSIGCKIEELRHQPKKEITYACYRSHFEDVLEMIRRLERAGLIPPG